jgi:hypothetical protein
MQVISHKRARVTGMTMLLAAGLFLLPVTTGHVDQMGYASAWAGDQGGGHDQVRGNSGNSANNSNSGNSGYTNYSAAPDPQRPNGPETATPCQTCRLGANGTGYEPQYVMPCHAQWCGGASSPK